MRYVNFTKDVYKDLIISTIVDDCWTTKEGKSVYKDLIISTIVDLYCIKRVDWRSIKTL